MENVKSPTKLFPMHLSIRAPDRNVLKELNNIEETFVLNVAIGVVLSSETSSTNLASKSSKETLNQPEIRVGEAKSLTNNLLVTSPDEHQHALQSPHNTNNLNETRVMLKSDGFANRPQDATFIATNVINNQTVVFGSASPNLNENFEVQYNTGPEIFLDVESVRHAQKTTEFNRTMNVEPMDLDGETDEFSLDSLKTKQRLPIDTAEKIFSSRKAPTFSEMFSNPDQTTNDNLTVNQPWDASFVIEKTDLSNEKSPVEFSIPFDGDDKMPLTMDDLANDGVATNEFKQPSVPLPKSEKQQKDDGNFIVLNSNDFEFLQSRGANSVDAENDPCSSLLLRFDLLSRRSLFNKKQSPGQTETTDADKTLTASNQCGDKRSTNESSSNGVLDVVAEVMDNDTNGYVNNIKSFDENIRKKMEEYEATQEILLKRITEKDKAITKTSNVLELYQKAIAEALAAKEKFSQNYEKENEELQTDRDVTYQHLLSLESTFADLHIDVKIEPFRDVATTDSIDSFHRFHTISANW